MDLSSVSKAKVEQFLNTDVKAVNFNDRAAAYPELILILREYRGATMVNNSLMAQNPKTKNNASPSNFPAMPTDKGDIEALTRYWFALFNWLCANGNGALSMLKPYMAGMFGQYMADVPSKMNPYVDGYLGEPAHDGTSNYAARGEVAAKTQTMPKGKVMAFDQRTKKMIFKDLI